MILFEYNIGSKILCPFGQTWFGEKTNVSFVHLADFWCSVMCEYKLDAAPLEILGKRKVLLCSHEDKKNDTNLL